MPHLLLKASYGANIYPSRLYSLKSERYWTPRRPANAHRSALHLNLHFRTLILFLYGTGIKIGDALALLDEHVDLVGLCYDYCAWSNS